MSPTFTVILLSLDTVNNIKTTMKDDFGNDVLSLPATGKGPCRVTLKPFEIGKDTRLLFKYSPFDIDNLFNQPSPVFVHAEAVTPYQDIHRFPPDIHADKDSPLTLIGYSAAQMMIFTQRIEQEKDIDTLITDIFAKHIDVSFLHVRHAETCCFICKIVRA